MSRFADVAESLSQGTSPRRLEFIVMLKRTATLRLTHSCRNLETGVLWWSRRRRISGRTCACQSLQMSNAMMPGVASWSHVAFGAIVAGPSCAVRPASEPMFSGDAWRTHVSTQTRQIRQAHFSRQSSGASWAALPWVPSSWHSLALPGVERAVYLFAIRFACLFTHYSIHPPLHHPLHSGEQYVLEKRLASSLA